MCSFFELISSTIVYTTFVAISRFKFLCVFHLVDLLPLVDAIQRYDFEEECPN